MLDSSYTPQAEVDRSLGSVLCAVPTACIEFVYLCRCLDASSSIPVQSVAEGGGKHATSLGITIGDLVLPMALASSSAIPWNMVLLQ